MAYARRVRWLGMLAGLAISSSVGAAMAEAEPRRHDGFTLRLSHGFALVRESRKVSYPERVPGGLVGVAADRSESQLLFGETGEVSLGGSPVPGWVVGGNVSQTLALNDGEPLAVLSFSPFVDCYVDPRRGFHVLGGPTLAATEGLARGGFVGAGYESWVSDGWSLGALLRVQYLRWRATSFEVRTLIVPSISLVGTYDR